MRSALTYDRRKVIFRSLKLPLCCTPPCKLIQNVFVVMSTIGINVLNYDNSLVVITIETGVIVLQLIQDSTPRAKEVSYCECDNLARNNKSWIKLSKEYMMFSISNNNQDFSLCSTVIQTWSCSSLTLQSSTYAELK